MKLFFLLLSFICIEANAKMTHVFYCLGENADRTKVFTEIHYQMHYSGRFLPAGIQLKKVPADYVGNLEQAFIDQNDFILIKYQNYCPRTEVFPALCKTIQDRNDPDYFYTWLNVGITTNRFSDSVLKQAIKVIDSQSYYSTYSYGRFNREYVGTLKKCNYKWGIQRP